MSAVRYNQSGYVGSSMSERAVAAYDAGEMPLTKWSKKYLLEELEFECEGDEELHQAILADIAPFSVATLKEFMLEWSSWHHTSKFANATNFYQFDAKFIEKYNKDKEALLAKMREFEAEAKEEARKAKEKARSKSVEGVMARCEWEEWEGSRRHGHYVKSSAYMIIIDGWAYSVPYGTRLERKKVTGNHFAVREEYARAPKGSAKDFAAIKKAYKRNYGKEIVIDKSPKEKLAFKYLSTDW